jgi:hypothetical protein
MTLRLLLNSSSSEGALPVRTDDSGTGTNTSANREVDEPNTSNTYRTTRITGGLNVSERKKFITWRLQ